VLANAQVTQLLFNTSSPEGNLTAYGVQYALNGGAETLTVGVKKEVILAGAQSEVRLYYSTAALDPRTYLTLLEFRCLGIAWGGQHMQDHLVSRSDKVTQNAMLTVTERLHHVEYRLGHRW